MSKTKSGAPYSRPARNGQITRQQEKFLKYILEGDIQREAYLKAYPSKKCCKSNTIDMAASKLMAKPHIKKRYAEMLEEVRKKELEECAWSRAEAIRTLKTVIQRNMEEMERIDAAANEEIEYLKEILAQAKENKDISKAAAMLETILKKKQRRHRSTIHNDGITKAVSELNKMQGYHEQTINMNGTVVFEGEDELED